MHNSTHGNPYDGINSGRSFEFGGVLGDWGKIMERFFDEYGTPDI